MNKAPYKGLCKDVSRAQLKGFVDQYMYVHCMCIYVIV